MAGGDSIASIRGTGGSPAPGVNSVGLESVGEDILQRRFKTN